MDFHVSHLKFECACGTPRTHVTAGISSLAEMVFQWKCFKCGKRVMSRIPLERLIADMPAHPEVKLLCEQSDADFLHQMHISMEERSEREGKDLL